MASAEGLMEIPLFPLHAVLCPGIALPLHVFEPRYRLLIKRCLASASPFGIVLILDGPEVLAGSVSIASVGTFAEIRESDRLADGRYDLLVIGSGRFSIESVDAEREPYLVAEVKPIEDDLGDADRASELADWVMRRFVAYLQLLQPMEGETAEEVDVQLEVETEVEPDPDFASERDPDFESEPDPEGLEEGRLARSAAGPAGADVASDPERERELEAAARRLIIPDDPTTLSYLLSGIIQVDPRRRQQLLEASSTESRLVALDRLIERELWMLRRRLRLVTPDDHVAAVRLN
jgi:Lon protease-like protein